MDIETYGGMPGMSAIVESVEAQVWSGRQESVLWARPIIKSSVVDAGNTPATTLRPGLVFGRKISDGLLYAYNPDAVDGTEVAYGILMSGISMLDASGVAANKQAHVMLAGLVKASAIITGQDGGLDLQARRQMLLSGRFQFDDDLTGKAAFMGLPLREVVKGANYTVLATDNGSLFAASAAAVFTLPAMAAGLCFEFLNLADANMQVASAAGTDIVWDNSAGVSSLTFSTASHKIGGHLQFYTNSAGTKWYVRNLSPATCTVTAA